MRKRNVVNDDHRTVVIPFTPSDSIHTSNSRLPHYSHSYYSPTSSFSSPESKRLPAYLQGGISTIDGPLDDLSSRGAHYGSHESSGWMADHQQGEHAGGEEDENISPPKYAPLRRFVVHNPGSFGLNPAVSYP